MRPDRDEVLYAFAVEPDHSRQTLERYLRDYPEHGIDLVAVSFQLQYQIDWIIGATERTSPLAACERS